MPFFTGIGRHFINYYIDFTPVSLQMEYYHTSWEIKSEDLGG